ncbi:MAG: hypothetical protein AAFX04_06130 [Pseudomonadota bacterium]
MIELLFAAMMPAQVAAQQPELDPRKPDIVTFGASTEEMMTQLEGLCTAIELRQFDPPRIPLAKESHSQIDCQGFDFLGRPRLAEFVFADDALHIVWILVEPGEKDAIIAAMRSTYGSDGQSVKAAIGFPEYRTAWRHEPAELLFYSETVAPMFEARLKQPQAE